MVRAAIRQLNDKDVRQRRRAVRKLFELDDPIAIDAFIPLLDDSDEWFRGKALMAIQRWASMKDLNLAEKLASSNKIEERILASRIATRVGKSSKTILKKLSEDEIIKGDGSEYMTAKDIEKEINELTQEGSAYWSKTHPNHNKAVQEVLKLREMLNG